MPLLAFDMNTANYESRRFEFRGKNNVDYYDGDLKPLSTANVDMRIEKSPAGEYGIYRLKSRTGLSFRRSWTHIRNDKTNLTIFWFLRRGRITISHSNNRHVVSPRECAITRSCQAFYMELVPDEGGELDVMHLVVPTHTLYPIIGDTMEMGKPLPASNGDLFLAERIFTLLFEEDEQIDDPETAAELIRTLLNGLGRTVERHFGKPAPRASISDRRIQDITRFISQNFANPDLNARMVADSCGISLRYLCHILKRHDLSFSNMVWERRMAAAQDWLKDERMQHHSISEIAYLAGFKSSAHFSRMFKMRAGVAPREFRQDGLLVAA